MFQRRNRLCLSIACLVPALVSCASRPFPSEELRAFAAFHVADKKIPAFSIVVVDDQEIVFAEGFGKGEPDSIYRVGSVSKIYTDIAVMRLVEQGKLDLDAPVARYLPAFQPSNGFGRPITTRHLMAHRSGLVREPPVGSYFDASAPSIASIVEGLADTEVLLEPGSKTKYSNAALVVVGAVVEAVAARPFVDHMRREILDPLGMSQSSFARLPSLESRIPAAVMWSYHREFPAPTFDVLVPAGNLYSSVLDQAKLMQAIFRGGAPLLEEASLDAMLTPQFDDDGSFGLGFALSEFEGRRRVAHGGAVYGFSTQFEALPDDKLGVVAAASRDFANNVVRRIAEQALRLAVAWKSGESVTPWTPPEPVEAETRARAAGRYASEDETIRLVNRGGELWIAGLPRHRVMIRREGEALVTDGVVASGAEVRLAADAVVIDETTYSRLPDDEPAAAPHAWGKLIGEYGWDHNTLFILERFGELCALVEWIPVYPLTDHGSDVWAFPEEGLYHDETIRFRRDARGRVDAAIMAGIEFPRRETAQSGETFRIKPVRPLDELRAVAAKAQPPESPESALPADLVDVTSLDPAIRLDIRYATTNNFLGSRVYPTARALLQRPAAEALARAHRSLREQGYGLLIHDAYRPWRVSKIFWEATPESMKDFVADPDQGSIHNRGAAVDLTLYDLATGRAVEMPSGYDEFSSRAFPDYPGGTTRQRWLRERLRAAMEAEGFEVYPVEWWHFNHRDAERYPILNLPLAEATR